MKSSSVFAITASLVVSLSACADEDVKSLYSENCASCHGEGLEGGQAGSMLDDVWVTDGSDKALAAAIRDGMDDAGMPAWGEMLDAEQIRTMVVYIREQRWAAKNGKMTKKDIGGTHASEAHDFTISEVASAEGTIWALDFLSDGSMVFTEKSGRLWHHRDGETSEVTGIPEVLFERQGGLMDVRAHPDHASNGWVYLSYAKKHEGADTGGTEIVRGRIKDGKWTDQELIFGLDQDRYESRGVHYGSRIVFRDGYIYFSTGDGGYQDRAQDKALYNGSVHRLHDDGRLPDDNPFVSEDGAAPSIWSWGHRNPQGLAESPDGRDIWETEHGPRGGDEVNIVRRGENYGWPKATFGMNYSGTPITEHTSLPGMTGPVYHWTPSIAVAGINFYTGDLFPGWKGNLMVASLGKQELHRLVIEDGKVVSDETVLRGLGRIRDVATGPDGALYITLNKNRNGAGKIVKLVPVE